MELLKEDFVGSIFDKYPKELLKARQSFEGALIACLLKDFLLLDETNLTSQMFITSDGRFFFDFVNFLRSHGLEKMDSAGVYSTISEQQKEEFEKRGGFDAVEFMTHTVDLKNWETILDHLYRELIIFKAYDNGLLSLDDRLVNYNSKKVMPIKELRKLTSGECKEYFETMVSALDQYDNSSIVLESTDIEFDDKWLEKLSEGFEEGVPFKESFNTYDGAFKIPIFPMLSDQIKGLLPGTLTYLGGYSNTGKSTYFIPLLMSLIAQGHKVLYISNEENGSRCKLKCLEWVIHNVFRNNSIARSDITSRKPKTPEQLEVIRKAQQWWIDNGLNERLHYIHISAADMSVVKKEIRKWAGQGFDVVIYDTFKIQINDIRNNRTDLYLTKDSRILDEIAKQKNLIMLCAVQLAEYKKGLTWLSSEALSNGKQIKEVAEGVWLIRPVYAEELDPHHPKFINPFTVEVDETLGTVQEPVDLDQSATYRVLFIEKSRTGANSDDINAAILYKFDGDFCSIEEVSWCQPKRGTIT